jgi:hypothetical protein
MTARQIDHLKRAGLEEAIRERIAQEHCCPVACVNDEIKRERNKNERSEKPHAPAEVPEVSAGNTDESRKRPATAPRTAGEAFCACIPTLSSSAPEHRVVQA